MRALVLSPSYPAETIGFTRGLAEVGVGVWGVGDTPRDDLPASVKPYLVDYLQVPRILDELDVMNRIADWLRGRSIDRVLANWEPVVMLAARLRERWGMPGMSVDTVRGFRDKELMKQRLRAAGLRVPKSARVRTAAEVYAAAESIGYPLVLKPIAGAGCANTWVVDGPAELETTLSRIGGLSEASCEEFIEGEEFTYDTLCMRGKPMYENVSLYVPKPLDASKAEWISPMCVAIRDLSQDRVTGGIALGKKVLDVLGMQDGFTHMEWFRKPSGEVVFGEIACRPGGAGIVDQMNYASDVDLYREWARICCWGHFEVDPTRKYNVAMIFKRARGWGHITRIEGLHDWLRMCGQWVVEERLARPGTPRRDWTQVQRADGHLIVRHPDWEETMRMASAAASGIQIYAQ